VYSGLYEGSLPIGRQVEPMAICELIRKESMPTRITNKVVRGKQHPSSLHMGSNSSTSSNIGNSNLSAASQALNFPLGHSTSLPQSLPNFSIANQQQQQPHQHPHLSHLRMSAQPQSHQQLALPAPVVVEPASPIGSPAPAGVGEGVCGDDSGIAQMLTMSMTRAARMAMQVMRLARLHLPLVG
jgi:hypothetical protein